MFHNLQSHTLFYKIILYAVWVNNNNNNDNNNNNNKNKHFEKCPAVF